MFTVHSDSTFVPLRNIRRVTFWGKKKCHYQQHCQFHNEPWKCPVLLPGGLQTNQDIEWCTSKGLQTLFIMWEGGQFLLTVSCQRQHDTPLLMQATLCGAFPLYHGRFAYSMSLTFNWHVVAQSHLVLFFWWRVFLCTVRVLYLVSPCHAPD